VVNQLWDTQVFNAGSQFKLYTAYIHTTPSAIQHATRQRGPAPQAPKIRLVLYRMQPTSCGRGVSPWTTLQ